MTKYIYTFLFLVFISLIVRSQSRIQYNGRQIFLNGSNFAWVSFARDIGPGSTNFNRFESTFQEVKAAGGNSMRLWLHTDGSNTPEFNSIGLVVGPGAGAIDDLKHILDLAEQYEVGLLLCLWSHDMLRSSNAAAILSRNIKLLTDTSATRAYINNALIPLVEGVKGHPGIIGWEIFNEPEGMSNQFGWSGWEHVDMVNFQRFVNWTAGAIHRADSTALVTNGSWGFAALTDVPTLAKVSPDAFLNSLTKEQKNIIEKEFEIKYGIHYSAEQIVHQYNKAIANYNYYSDVRLIAVGGDLDGTLDFYTVHYYSWAGTALSPFHHPYSYWNLSKPLAIAEFFMVDVFGVRYQDLYEKLYSGGYAGAMSWQWWGDTGDYNNDHSRTVASMNYMYQNYPQDIVINPRTGTIYSFTITPLAIEKGDTALVKWNTEFGSAVTLNGESVADTGRKYVNPSESTFYELIADGQLHSNKTVHLEVHPAGRIFSFEAIPNQIEAGDTCLLKWSTARGSIVTINGVSVDEKDSMKVSPTETTDYELQTTGDVSQSLDVILYVLPPLQVNRALNKSVIVSSSETETGNDNPAYIVDGNFFTLWTSGHSDNQWLEIDLERIYKVDKMILYWGDDFATNYRFGFAVEKNGYNLVHTISNGQGGVEEYDGLNSDGRYLKIVLDKRAVASGGFSFIEIEVYGIKNPTDVDNKNISRNPGQYSLSRNYPNPFNPTTTIEYSIPGNSFVNLEVYNILGSKVGVLVNDYKNAGSYKVNFNGSNLASGIYYYRLRSNKYLKTEKMILLK
jgi:hypothetical protein